MQYKKIYVTVQLASRCNEKMYRLPWFDNYQILVKNNNITVEVKSDLRSEVTLLVSISDASNLAIMQATFLLVQSGRPAPLCFKYTTTPSCTNPSTSHSNG